MSSSQDPSRSRAALFDLDRTLLSVNSGTLWIRAEYRAGRLPVGAALRAMWWIARYSIGRADMTYAFEAAGSSVQGLSEELLAERTRAWFDAEIRDTLRPGVPAVLAAHREAGERLVLATSGTRYIAALAVEAYGLDEAISTRFEVEDGVFTGRIAALAYGEHKLHRAREWAEAVGVDLADCAFYTDSVSDLALLEAVGRPVVVAPDRPLARLARERGWPVADWGP